MLEFDQRRAARPDGHCLVAAAEYLRLGRLQAQMTYSSGRTGNTAFASFPSWSPFVREAHGWLQPVTGAGARCEQRRGGLLPWRTRRQAAAGDERGGVQVVCLSATYLVMPLAGDDTCATVNAAHHNPGPQERALQGAGTDSARSTWTAATTPSTSTCVAAAGRRPSRSATARTPASASRHPSARLATHPRMTPFAT